MPNEKAQEAVKTPTTPEEELAELMRLSQESVNATKDLLAAQSKSANESVDASLALARTARKVRQSSPGMKAVRPPITSDLTSKMEALKVK